MKFKQFLIISLLGMLTFSCIQDDMDDMKDDENDTSSNEKVFILNEGAFSANNASLSVYYPDSQNLVKEVFSAMNGFPLGDVAQSMKIIDDSLLWIVVNNSGKIEVANANSAKSIETIEGFTSPRELLKFNDDKVYVSDLISSRLNIVDISTMEKSGSIDLTHPVEEIVKHNNQQIIAAGWSGNNQLYKIDVNTEAIIDSLEVTYEPNSLEYDDEGNLWVMCSGGYVGSDYREEPKLLKVDPATMTIEDSFSFSSSDHYPTEMEYSKSEDALYYLLGSNGGDTDLGVYKFSIDNNNLPTQPLIPRNTDGRFYKLIMGREGTIWVTDGGDFSSPGTVYHYDNNGNNIEEFNAGIAPNAVLRYKPE